MGEGFFSYLEANILGSASLQSADSVNILLVSFSKLFGTPLGQSALEV